MTSIIYDTDAIGKIARLKALEGRPQNAAPVQPMTVDTGQINQPTDPTWFYGTVSGGNNTEPCVYVPSDFDPA